MLKQGPDFHFEIFCGYSILPGPMSEMSQIFIYMNIFKIKKLQKFVQKKKKKFCVKKKNGVYFKRYIARYKT